MFTETITYNMPPVSCPQCGRPMNAAGGPGVPLPGDHTVCMGCLAALTYTEAMTVRLLTAEEVAALPSSERDDIAAVRAELRAFAAVVGPLPLYRGES